MEIQLSLDSHGRTTWAKPLQASSDSTNERTETNEDSSTPLQNAVAPIDFSSKTIMTSLVSPPEESKQEYEEWKRWMDDVLFDCEISDSALMPRTFWMPADGTKARCVLEQMALDVFRHHVPENYQFDPDTSGAEWWVQIRPSPAAGRYTMHDQPQQDDDMAKKGISFHWDKDEDLRLLAGGSLYVHPYLSTVTYFTNLGAPTMTVNCRIDTFTGEWMLPEQNQESFVSWPKQGKHLSFDGQFLHAAPSNLMENGVFERQCTIHDAEIKASDDSKEMERQRKVLGRRRRRVTFLVNIWLNYRPFNVEPFPDTMIDKLTKVDGSKWSGMFNNTHIESNESEIAKERNVTVSDGKAKDDSDLPSDKYGQKVQSFTWPMGDCDSGEYIRMQMPLESIRSAASSGGNVRIRWTQGAEPASVGVHLYKDAKPPAKVQDTGKEKSIDDGTSDTGEGIESHAKRFKSNCAR